MKKLIVIVIALIIILPLPVSALDIEAPIAPEAADEYMPENAESFAQGVWYILKKAVKDILPEIYESAGLCLSVFAVILLSSMVDSFAGLSSKVLHLASAVMIGLILINPANALIKLGTDTIHQMSEYGNLLIPVLTSALAAQGGVTASTALYSITVFFGSLLTTAITKIAIPMLYIYFCLCLVNGAIGDQTVKNLQDFMKWLITWALKILLYAFTGFIGVTGVVSGSADASAVKAVKLTISGMVPLVGGTAYVPAVQVLLSIRWRRSYRPMPPVLMKQPQHIVRSTLSPPAAASLPRRISSLSSTKARRKLILPLPSFKLWSIRPSPASPAASRSVAASPF